MHSVATGVGHFKAGEHGKAMKYFDHALDIDSENVEGLVARGALWGTIVVTYMVCCKSFLFTGSHLTVSLTMASTNGPLPTLKLHSLSSTRTRTQENTWWRRMWHMDKSESEPVILIYGHVILLYGRVILLYGHVILMYDHVILLLILNLRDWLVGKLYFPLLQTWEGG